jgi:hypothetical protein
MEEPPTRPSVYNANQMEPIKIPESAIAVNQNQSGFWSFWKVHPRVLIRPVAQALNKDQMLITANKTQNKTMIFCCIGTYLSACLEPDRLQGYGAIVYFAGAPAIDSRLIWLGGELRSSAHHQNSLASRRRAYMPNSVRCLGDR